MHIDARNLENNSIIQGDICIIGAGSSGISVALEYINTSYKVILLEGGGFEYDDKVQNLYKGKTTGQKYYPLKSSRLHYFGGASQHWGGMCSPLDEIDFKKRDWIEHSGWPISKKDLDPYYKRAQKNLDLGPNEYNLEYWKNKNPSYVAFPLNKDVIWNKMWQFSAPTRFGTKYKNTIIDAENIHLYTYANVVDISANKKITSINEVIIKNHAGKTHKVKAKHFVLACGAIQNARLLLASNSQSKNGLGNSKDLVGRYFMEHPEINSAELWLKNPQSMSLYLMSNKVPNPPRAELAIREKRQNELKILNGTVSFLPLAQARRLKSNMETWQDENPIINKKNRSGESKSFMEKVQNKFKAYKEEQVKGISNAFQLYIRLEQNPNPNSRVTLDNEKDALGVPRANLHWELTSLEKYSIRKIFEVLGEQFGLADIGRVKLSEFLRNTNDLKNPNFNGGWHHIGTTRMSISPDHGVVDSNCKVHDINNLFIAGSSCFPTSGAANPTLTIVALSIRISDHIKTLLKKTVSVQESVFSVS